MWLRDEIRVFFLIFGQNTRFFRNSTYSSLDIIHNTKDAEPFVWQKKTLSQT